MELYHTSQLTRSGQHAVIATIDNFQKTLPGHLGFLPIATIRDHVDRGNVIIAASYDPTLSGRVEIAGYILWGQRRNMVTIHQLAVVGWYRRQGIGRRLVQAVISETCWSADLYKCRVATDLHSYGFWEKVGFQTTHVSMPDKKGRRIAQLQLGISDQLEETQLREGG